MSAAHILCLLLGVACGCVLMRLVEVGIGAADQGLTPPEAPQKWIEWTPTSSLRLPPGVGFLDSVVVKFRNGHTTCEKRDAGEFYWGKFYASELHDSRAWEIVAYRVIA